MNNIPIVFTFDSHEVLPASIAIKTLIDSKNNDTNYDIYVLCDASINEKIKNKFKKIAKINWIEIDKNIFKDCPIKETWPEAVYYRLLIPNFIKNYDKVIYSDTDVFFKKDLSELYNTNIENYDWAGVLAERNSSEIECHTYYPENSNEFVYMSGFMLMNLKKMRDENKVEKFFETIKTYKDRLKMFDLEVLNISCDNVLDLPFKYCMLVKLYENQDITLAPEYPWLTKYYTKEYLEKEKEDTAIVHYAGELPKIWDREPRKIPDYYMNYILDSPFSNRFFIKHIKNFVKNIFSVQKQVVNENRYILIRILGIKIKIKRRRK